MAQHKDLTGLDLHEPKGADGASAGQVYVADGSGSGVWTDLVEPKASLSGVIDDISTAADIYLAVGIAGTISRIDAVLGAAISGADAVVTFYINGVSITGSSITVANSGSAAGDDYHKTPSSANVVAAGDVIKISTDGASTGTAKFQVTLTIDA